MDTSKSEVRIAWIPTSEAGRMLRVSRQRVQQLIESGGLHAMKLGRQWLVSRRSVESRIALLREEDERVGDSG